MAERGPERLPTRAGERRGTVRGWRRFAAVCGVLASLLYLANPSAGFVELLPDNLPFIGNLDEVGVTGFLILCLRALGIDPIPGGRREKR